MSIHKNLVNILTALIVTAGSIQTSKAEALRIGIPTWVGFGPMYIADEKGFFRDEEVDVHLIKFDAGTYEALFNGFCQISVHGSGLV